MSRVHVGHLTCFEKDSTSSSSSSLSVISSYFGLKMSSFRTIDWTLPSFWGRLKDFQVSMFALLIIKSHFGAADMLNIESFGDFSFMRLL